MTSHPPDHRDAQLAGIHADEERLQELRRGLAHNPALPASLVDQLIALGDAAVCLELADRDDLGEDHIRLLAGRGDAAVVTRLLERGLLLPREVDRFDPQIVIAMADLAPVRDDWARQIATSPDPAIRAAIAATTYLPGDVVAALTDDPDLEVVAEAARSPRITEPLVERLATHPHVSIRRALACNEHAPSHLLVAASWNPHGFVLGQCTAAGSVWAAKALVIAMRPIARGQPPWWSDQACVPLRANPRGDGVFASSRSLEGCI